MKYHFYLQVVSLPKKSTILFLLETPPFDTLCKKEITISKSGGHELLCGLAY